jgi:hypothetical protein
VVFEKAEIKIEHEKEFSALRAVIARAFASSTEKFLHQVQRKGLRVRRFEEILAARVFEAIDATLLKSGVAAKNLYEALTLPDQGQMREFYLSELEQISAPLRHKFHKLYQYY